MIVKNVSGQDRFFQFAPTNPAQDPFVSITPGLYLANNATATLGDTDAILAQVQLYITAGSIQLVSGGPSEPMGIVATPSSVALNELFGYATVGTGSNLAGVTNLVFNDAILLTLTASYGAVVATISIPNVTTVPGVLSFSHDVALTSLSIPLLATAGSNVSVDNCSALPSLSLPALTTVTGNLTVDTNALLVTLDLPLLATVSGTLSITANVALTTVTTVLATATGLVTITGNTALTSLDLSHLVTAPNGMTVTGNTSLATLNLAALVPTNAKNYNFSNSALPAAQVNAILARFIANAGYVSGTINLSGGTNAAPTGQGATDKAALGVRGCTVTTN